MSGFGEALGQQQDVQVLILLKSVLHLSLETRPGADTLLQASTLEPYEHTVHPYRANRTE
jgi:hypothetical protein